MDIRAMSTFRRFELADRVDFGVEEILKRLEKRKFLPLDDGKGGGAVEETERFGWVTCEHLFDTRFEIEKVFRDPYIVFQLRIDKRKIPQNLFRAHLKIEERAIENATGKRVGPARRKELREQVRLKLIEKVMPAASAYQVVWSKASGIVWFGNTGEKACECFVQQFEDTFEVALIAQTPRYVGLRILKGDAEPIDRAATTAFSKRAPSYQLVGATR